jgi:glycosyltransferase involved in cell wall biosynthesis
MRPNSRGFDKYNSNIIIDPVYGENMKRDKAPISILMISAAYESQGGVATHLNYLSHALTEIEGIKKVTVLTMRRSNSQTKIQPGNPYIWRSEFDDHQSQPGRRAIYDKILTDALNNWKKYPHDIIHAHDLDSIFVGLLLKTAFNKPIVATIHRAPTKWKHERYKDSPKDLFMQLMLTYRTIDRIVVPSLSSMEVLKDQGFNPKNIKLIKHGIDYEKYVTSFKSDDELVNRLGLDDKDTKIIFCPVRADEHKNPETFLKAAQEIIDNNKTMNIKFILTCTPKGKYAHLNRIISNKKLKSMVLLEEFNYSKMPTLYRHASVCVIPSIRESFGQTVLEAFAFKVPVVAANMNALSELIIHSKTGLHFDAASSTDLAKQVNFLLDNPKESKRIGREGYNALLGEYHAKRMAEDYYRLYQDILS